jgi:hypothetical protein
VHVYPVSPDAASSVADGGVMVAVRVADLVTPLRNGGLPGGDCRPALVIGGTWRIRTGEPVVFCKIVAVAPAQVRRDGRVQAKGSPVHHATLGPLEEWLEEQAGPGVIDGIAERAVLREEYVKGERERLLASAFMIRAIVLMTLVPGAGVRDAVIALAGDLALVPWARPWVPASERAPGDWRNALGPEPLEELQAIVLRASWQEHEDRDWRAVVIGRDRPLKAGAVDGTLIRVPDTPANRAGYGSVGTGDDSSPFPQLRGLPMTDASTRGLLGMPHGPAGTDKAAAEQKLLDTAMREFPHLFAMDRIWLMDRNYPGAARIARLTACTHVLIRLKSDIALKRVSEILADGSYLAEISGDGVTVTVRVIEYWVTVEGQHVPELFCLLTDLMDIAEYPAAELAALYRWRWDGSETALREAKASLDGAGPSAGPMLRSGSPGLVRQELAAWAAGNEMTRGTARAAAAAAVPARKGRRAGMPVQAREISHGRTRRAVLAAIRAGATSRMALASELAKHRTVIDRNRHRARKAKCASTFPRAGRADTSTRIAAAVITLANMPA